MNRVTRRVWIMLIFIGILVGGLGFFLFEYAAGQKSGGFFLRCIDRKYLL